MLFEALSFSINLNTGKKMLLVVFVLQLIETANKQNSPREKS